MDGTHRLPPGNNGFARLIEALRKKDPELNAFASDVFIRVRSETGTAVVPALVREACCKGKLPGHRIRILDVVQRIGEPLAADAYFDLMHLAGHRVLKVAVKASEVIAKLSPRGQYARP